MATRSIRLSRGARVALGRDENGYVLLSVSGAGLAQERRFHERTLAGIVANVEVARLNEFAAVNLFDGEEVDFPTIACAPKDFEALVAFLAGEPSETEGEE